MKEKNMQKHNYAEELLKVIRSDISDDKLVECIEQYHENDVAEAFEMLGESERKRLYSILDTEYISEIFTYIEDVDEYIAELDIKNAAKIIENMDSDDAVDVLEEIDSEAQAKIVGMMDDESSHDILMIQSYDDDEMGSLMTTNFIDVSRNLTVKAAMRALVDQAGENDNISTIYTHDENNTFCGAIDLKDLIIAREHTELLSIISESYPYVRDHDKISDCIEELKDYAEDSIPVLDEINHILGVITAQDITEAVDDAMGDDYAKLAGLTSEEDLNETLLESMKKRMPWLIALLFLGMMVSTVVGMFEAVVSRIAIVVCFQSLILDMAGNVGTQSLAVTIRVLMDENLSAVQKVSLVLKEMRVALCNGGILGIMAFIFIGAYVCIFKQGSIMYSLAISGCVGVSLLAAMVISGLVGTVVPMFFHKIKIDPAVASGPLITTVNDLVAVITYYGLSWILLINILNF